MKSQQRSRRRGVILTTQGLQKLQNAKSQSEQNENFDKRYTGEDLGFRMGLDPDTVAKVFACELGVDKQTLKYCFAAFNLQLESQDYQFANSDKNLEKTNTQIQNSSDWGEAPDVSLFCGRSEELATLKQWILNECPTNKALPCRLITLLGMGGIGKTWLSVKLTQQLQDQFEFVIWRSLLPRPPLKDLLSDLITFLSNGQDTNLPDNLHSRVSRLIDYLQRHRCLLVLDGAEAVLQDCATYKSPCRSCFWFPKTGNQEYREFFQRLGEVAHHSCVILTSCNKPKEITSWEGETFPVRAFHLYGLQMPDIQELLNAKGNFEGSPEDWDKLVECYAGHPLALNLVSNTIQNLFAGNIGEFLQQQTPIFGELSHLLEQQWQCLSDTHKQVLKSLAFHCQPISFTELRSQLASSISPQTLLAALESLQARSLIETNGARLSLHPLVMEYLNSQLIPEHNIQIQSSILLEQQQLQFVI
ncbi:NB-ARC domain-containing protein [Nostoc sp. UHCC 0870]|uniref:NB-ARC domain-containing protein n=1 Tax=Nostoc sp. UHCC 0870 TaxID=2914041 RepID=UPI001EDC97E5|nr:NB-ARC domain-containing protein [Nostoc sp. UHCC 0870]UKO98630.1 NB-ARC domain-containing protein [Nostoc sp. UHCC 0870]